MRVLKNEEFELAFGGRDGDGPGGGIKGGGETNGEKALDSYFSGDVLGGVIHMIDQTNHGDYNDNGYGVDSNTGNGGYSAYGGQDSPSEGHTPT